MDGLDQLFTVTNYQAIQVVLPLAKSSPTLADKSCNDSDHGNDHPDNPPSSFSSSSSIITIELFASPQASTDFDRTGQILWPVSHLLAHYLVTAAGQARLSNATVIELGAGGTGLPSLVAAATGVARRVVVTDGNGDVILKLLQQNVEHFQTQFPNSPTKLRAEQLVWGHRQQLEDVWQSLADNNNDGKNAASSASSSSLPYADVVLAADVVQWPAVLEPLLHTVRALLWRSPRAQPVLLLGIVNRAASTYHSFFQLAAHMGFGIQRKIHVSEIVPPDGTPLPDSCREYGGRETELYELILTDPERTATACSSTCQRLPLLLQPLEMTGDDADAAHRHDLTIGTGFEHTFALPC